VNGRPGAPLVSIVTPVYNGMPFVAELIESVLEQDYPNIEHIVIDDGSTDDGATVRALQSYPGLRWWSRDNRGQYETLNEGLAASTGDIVTVISADDRYASPDAVGAAVDYLLAHAEYDCVFGRVLDIAEDGEVLDPQTRPAGRWVASLLGVYLFIPHCGLFLRREVLGSADLGFDPSLSYAGDWEWMLRLKRSGARFGYLDKALACYRTHAAQTVHTAGSPSLHMENRRVCRMHGTSYVAHVAIERSLTVRSVVLKGVSLLRREGFAASLRACREWVARRTARRRSGRL